MGAARHKTGKPGVFFRKHGSRKHGVSFDKCYLVAYKHEGKTIEETVGWSSQGVSLNDAVALRNERLSLSRRKKDGQYDGPVTRKEFLEAKQERKELASTKLSVAEFSLVYLNTVKSEGKTTWEDDNRRLAKEILPVIGSKKIEAVTTADLSGIVTTLRKKSPVSSNRLVSLLQKFLSVAVSQGVIKESPAAPLKKIKEHARERVLSADEIKSFWQYLEANRSTTTADLLKVLVLTGKRTGEVLGMRWSEIEADTWTIPRERVKNRKKSVQVYLSWLVMAILSRRKLTSESDYVFPNRDGGSLNSKVCARFVHRASFDFHVHDIRRTCTTLLASQEVSPFVIDRVLGHSDGSVRGQVYDQFQYESRLREAWNVLSMEVLRCLL